MLQYVGMSNFLSDFFFPRYCNICGKKGDYLCNLCKKLFKRNLPECYTCRRLSSDFNSHSSCKSKKSLYRIFVCWEYNRNTSNILKKLKYKYVTDTSETLFTFFLELLTISCFKKHLKGTLLIPVPLSNNRFRERGFNQSELLARYISKNLNIDIDNDLIFRSIDSKHQASKNKDERKYINSDSFKLIGKRNLNHYKSITIVDDVITTGSTLEAIASCIRGRYPDITIQGLCMFRGRAKYSFS